MNADLWYPIATAAAAGGLLIASQRRNGFNRKSTLHGSARWAATKDLRRAGLLGNDGVYVGAWKQGNRLRYLRVGGGKHVLVVAPTGGGKSVGVVIPTLLSYLESVFVLDLKGELWALTAGWRQQHAGNKVLRFEPAAAEGSCCFNPLDEVRVGTSFDVGDAQNIAMIIVDPDGKGLSNFWDKSGQTILSGCILHLCHQARQGGPPATLPELDRMLASPNRPIMDLWKEMQQSPHPLVSRAGQEMVDRQKAPGEASGIISTAKACLSGLFRDPIVARNVSRSDFRIADLMHADCPVSLYLITEGDDQVRLSPLTRILVNLVLRRLASGMEFEAGQAIPSFKHRLLLVLDEFASLRLPIFEKALAYMRFYGLCAVVVVQDRGQLHAAYGQEESISANCGVLAAFPPAPSDQATAEYLSKLTGVTTVLHEQVTRNGRGLFGSVSRTLQAAARPLLTPDECLRLQCPTMEGDRVTDPGEMLIFAKGIPAIRAQQLLYFQDPVFQARAAVPPPAKSDALVAEQPPAPKRDEQKSGNAPSPSPIRVEVQMPLDPARSVEPAETLGMEVTQ
jgi:type IV secretion system protein VirD4